MEFKDSQFREGHLDLIMELKTGSVRDLIGDDVFVDHRDLTRSLLHQMLQALDYLDYKKLTH